MTFNQIAWKMATVNVGKYLFYFLANSFAVMFIFIFLTVFLNGHLAKAKELEGIQDALMVPTAALVIFSVFFISQSHSIFMKRRRNEFALFMTLGMTRKDIGKLLLVENGSIAILSSIAGLAAGTVFSRLMFLLLLKGLGLESIPFQLAVKMYGYTLAGFTAIFMVAVGNSLLFTLKEALVLSMKSSRAADSIKNKSPLLGAAGFILAAGSLCLLYVLYTKPGMQETIGGYLLLFTAFILIGVYLCLYQFTSFLIELAKKSKSFYYPRLLFLTSLDYKFRQLTAIQMLVTVMAMVTIFYSTLLLFFYNGAEKTAIEENPYDLAFLKTETKNQLAPIDVKAIFAKKGIEVKNQLEVPFLMYYWKPEISDVAIEYSFMPIEAFNELTSGKKTVADGEIISFINLDPKYIDHLDEKPGMTYAVGARDFTLKETFAGKFINNVSHSHQFFIVSESAYDEFLKEKDVFEAKIHLLSTGDWEETGGAIDELEERLAALNKAAAPIEDLRTENGSEEDLLRIASRVGEYEKNKNLSGMMFFVISFLSVLFFLGTFILLYLNLFSTIDAEKKKYRQLQKIGITKKEVKRIVARELAVLFFIPAILGALLAYFYLLVLSTDIGGIMENPEMFAYFFSVAGVYVFIQACYYVYSFRKMIGSLVPA